MDECQSRKQLMFLNWHRGSVHRRVQDLHHWEAEQTHRLVAELSRRTF